MALVYNLLETRVSRNLWFVNIWERIGGCILYNTLFTPITIGNVVLKNRIVFPPLTTGYEEDYKPSKRSIHFYESIAKGGAGLVTIGDLSASKNYSMNPHFYDDSFIPSNRMLVDAVHAAGAKIAAQVYHGEYNPEELDESSKRKASPR